jgi:hypothetical protein
VSSLFGSKIYKMTIRSAKLAEVPFNLEYLCIRVRPYSTTIRAPVSLSDFMPLHGDRERRPYLYLTLP